MRIVADENIPLLDEFFAGFGEIRNGCPVAAVSMRPPSPRPSCYAGALGDAG